MLNYYNITFNSGAHGSCFNFNHGRVPLGRSEIRSVIRSLGSLYIKGAGESTLSKDSPAPLIHNDTSDLGSLILFQIIPRNAPHDNLDDAIYDHAPCRWHVGEIYYKLEFCKIFKNSYTPSIYLDLIRKSPNRNALVKFSSYILQIKTGG